MNGAHKSTLLVLFLSPGGLLWLLGDVRPIARPCLYHRGIRPPPVGRATRITTVTKTSCFEGSSEQLPSASAPEITQITPTDPVERLCDTAQYTV